MSDQRRIEVSFVERVASRPGELALRLHGRNTSGAVVSIVAVLSWGVVVPLLLNRIRDGWRIERERRENETAAIGEAIGGAQFELSIGRKSA